MHWCCRTVSITLVMLRRIDFLEVMTCPHQTMVRAPWTISHKYHSIIDFWLKKYLFYTGWHRNAAFEMLFKFGLSWVLSGKNTGLTSQCGSWHNTSYGRHLQVRAKYWKKFMQLVITFTLQVEACSRAIFWGRYGLLEGYGLVPWLGSKVNCVTKF